MNFTRLRKIGKTNCYLRHVCLSVRLQHLDSVWGDFVQSFENVSREIEFY